MNFNTFSAEDELSRPDGSFAGAKGELTRPKVWVNLEAFFSVFYPIFYDGLIIYEPLIQWFFFQEFFVVVFFLTPSP